MVALVLSLVGDIYLDAFGTWFLSDQSPFPQVFSRGKPKWGKFWMLLVVMVFYKLHGYLSCCLLAPTGALIVMMVYLISIHTQFIDAINWCYKCHSKSLKQYQCNWCHKMKIDADWMSNVHMFQCSNVPMIQCSNVPIFLFQCLFLFIGSQ